MRDKAVSTSLRSRFGSKAGRTLWVVLGVAIFGLCSAPAAADLLQRSSPPGVEFGPSSNGLALGIGSVRTTFKVGEPIRITVALRNGGGPITTGFAPRLFYQYKWRVKGAGGQKVPMRKPDLAPWDGSAGEAQINSGGFLVETYNLNNYYDLAPGTYRIVVKKDVVGLPPGPQLHASLTSAEIKIHIVP